MKRPSETHFEASPAVLGAFVRAVASAGDSPTVIRRVAENTAYVDLCRRIAALADTPDAPPPLAEACRKAGITLPHLKARLTPVARALHLMPEEKENEHYRVLGVAPDSAPEAIKRAYRQRVRDLHPDLQPRQAGDHEAFTRLTAAYEILSDPVAREAYDARRQPEGSWFEPDPQPQLKRPRQSRFTAVIVAVLVLVAATLLLDLLDRESARQNVYRASHNKLTRPLPPPGQPAGRVTGAPSPAPEAPGPAPAPVNDRPTPPAQAAVIVPTLMAAAPPTAAPPAPVDQPPPTAPEAPPPPIQEPLPTAAPHAAAPDAGARAASRRHRLAVFHAPGADARLAEKLRDFLAREQYPEARLAPTPQAREGGSSIRYFNAADKAAARDLRGAIQTFLAGSAKHPDLSVGLVNLSRRYPEAKPGRLEVWLNTGPSPAGTTTPLAVALQASEPAVPAPEAPPAAEAAAPDGETEARIRYFLKAYCRTYETRDPERLARFFHPTATENGQPFQDLLPRYRTNLANIAQLSYRIDIERWTPHRDAGLLVEGRFTALGECTDRKQYSSHGTIALDIVPHGASYRVARLQYEVE